MRQVGIKEERRIHRNGENNGTRNLKIFGQAGRLNLLAAEEAGARQAIISHTCLTVQLGRVCPEALRRRECSLGCAVLRG